MWEKSLTFAGMKAKVTIILACLLAAVAMPCGQGGAAAANRKARKATNAQQARAIFNRVYGRVFGPDGCRLSYSVNIIGLYKTAGHIALKGRKGHYTEKRYLGWSDGRTLWRVDTKKGVIDIFDMAKENKENTLSRFKFDLDKFTYSWQKSAEGTVINVDAPSGSGGIRHAKIVLDSRTEAPVALKIKVAFFWTTVRLSGFRAGGVSDAEFRFPSSRFKGYMVDDHRGE